MRPVSLARSPRLAGVEDFLLGGSEKFKPFCKLDCASTHSAAHIEGHWPSCTAPRQGLKQAPLFLSPPKLQTTSNGMACNCCSISPCTWGSS